VATPTLGARRVGEPGPIFPRCLPLNPSPALRSLLVLLFPLAAAAPAQGRAVVPAVAATWPGNAAVSLPLRWSQGTLQVCVSSAILPAAVQGQLRGVRMRRPALLGEPPYAAVQRTLTVRACFTPTDPTSLGGALVANRPANLQVVAGPAAVAVAATQPANGAAPLGAEFLVVPFATPLPVTAGNLFLEFEVTDAPLTIGDAWVDAVWLPGGVDHGYATAIGDGTCTLGPQPLQMQWSAAGGPQRSTTATLVLRGAPPGAAAFAFAGIEPETRAPGAGYVGFGGDLAGIDPNLAGCRQWTPIDVLWFGTADAGGNYTLTFPIDPAVTQPRMRVGVQAGIVDFARPGLPLSVGNGALLMLDSAGVDNRCATVFFPGPATTSPWGAQVGLMPVLVLDL